MRFWNDEKISLEEQLYLTNFERIGQITDKLNDALSEIKEIKYLLIYKSVSLLEENIYTVIFDKKGIVHKEKFSCHSDTKPFYDFIKGLSNENIIVFSSLYDKVLDRFESYLGIEEELYGQMALALSVESPIELGTVFIKDHKDLVKRVNSMVLANRIRRILSNVNSNRT